MDSHAVTDVPKQQTGFQGCPVLGVGLGYRREWVEETLATTDLLDWLEITPENYMGRGGVSQERLLRAAKQFPLVSHGVNASMGGASPWDEEYLTHLEVLFALIDPPWFSDHLCLGRHGTVYFNDLIPLPRTRNTVEYVASRIKALQDRFQRPILIEHISYYLDYPVEEQLEEMDFVAQVLERADCGLLLDVNNVYVNGANFDYEPKAAMNRLPLERVVQIHMAGHHQDVDGAGESLLVDTHGAPVCDAVWDLLEWVLSQPTCNPCGVMIERDTHMPPFADVVPEVRQLRQICAKTLGSHWDIPGPRWTAPMMKSGLNQSLSQLIPDSPSEVARRG